MKKSKHLFIFDLDNTLSDTFNIWGESLDYALSALAKSRKIDRNVLEEELQKNYKEKKVFVGIDLIQTINLAPCLKPKNKEEALRFEKDDARIIHEWQKIKQKATPYKGAIATLHKIKNSGGKVVIYSDAKESSCVSRLAKMNFPPNLIDGIYVQPDLDKEGKKTLIPLTGLGLAFRNALSNKIVVLEPKTSKPNIPTVQKILKDFNVNDKSLAVMIGDNIRADGGGAIGAGVDFAWQKQGTLINQKTFELYEKFSISGEYVITADGHYKQMNDSNKPTIILENGIPDVLKYYRSGVNSLNKCPNFIDSKKATER